MEAVRPGQTRDLSASKKSSYPKPRSLGNERENTLLVEDDMLPDQKPSEGITYCSLPCALLGIHASSRAEDVALQPPETRRETPYSRAGRERDSPVSDL